jgi:hypothetical protein
MPGGQVRFVQNILTMSKRPSGHGIFELVFIGTVFSDENLKNIQKLNDSTYFFESDKATYSVVNVEKGIKDFTFDINTGIIKYTDARNVKWKRI